MKVLDMGAGGGYSSELIARTVGATGKVLAQNSPTPNERAKANFDARMQKPAMKIVTALARPFDDPLPEDENAFDLITFLFYYHDTTYMQVNRAQMNQRLLAALKPGGLLLIADHSAKAGEATTARTGPLQSELVVAMARCGHRRARQGSAWRHESALHFALFGYPRHQASHGFSTRRR